MVTFNVKIVSIKSVFTSNVTLRTFKMQTSVLKLQRYVGNFMVLICSANSKLAHIDVRNFTLKLYLKFSVQWSGLNPSFLNQEEVALNSKNQTVHENINTLVSWSMG